MKKRGLFVFMLCVFLAAGAAVAAEPIPLEKINPSYIYIGPVGDGGWTYMQDAGREIFLERRKKRSNASKLKDTFSTIHDRYLILAHQFLTCLLVIKPKALLITSCF